MLGIMGLWIVCCFFCVLSFFPGVFRQAMTWFVTRRPGLVLVPLVQFVLKHWKEKPSLHMAWKGLEKNAAKKRG